MMVQYGLGVGGVGEKSLINVQYFCFALLHTCRYKIDLIIKPKEIEDDDTSDHVTQHLKLHFVFYILIEIRFLKILVEGIFMVVLRSKIVS